ncbi:MAG: DUF3187 family protein [Candidatus Zixiibacteriota bacterium]
MKTRFYIIAVLALMIWMQAPAVRASGQDPFGPLHITGQTPLQTLRLDVVPARPAVLQEGQVEFSQFNTWTNRWNKTEHYILDLEIIQNIFSASTGIGNNLEVGVSVPMLSRFGGKLDKFISHFHDSFGLGQSDRDKFPENNILVSYVDEASGDTIIVLDKSKQGTIIGDISLTSRWQAFLGDSWLKSVMVSGLLRFPTASERDFYGSGGIDVALSVSAVQKLAPLYVYSTVGFGRYGSRSIYDIDMRGHQWTFFTAVEWAAKQNFSLIIQGMANSGTTRRDNEFSQPTYELVLGAKHRLFHGVLLEYGLMENLFFFNNSNDFGINLGITVSR